MFHLGSGAMLFFIYSAKMFTIYFSVGLYLILLLQIDNSPCDLAAVNLPQPEANKTELSFIQN